MASRRSAPATSSPFFFAAFSAALASSRGDRRAEP